MPFWSLLRDPRPESRILFQNLSFFGLINQRLALTLYSSSTDRSGSMTLSKAGPGLGATLLVGCSSYRLMPLADGLHRVPHSHG